MIIVKSGSGISAGCPRGRAPASARRAPALSAFRLAAHAPSRRAGRARSEAGRPTGSARGTPRRCLAGRRRTRPSPSPGSWRRAHRPRTPRSPASGGRARASGQERRGRCPEPATVGLKVLTLGYLRFGSTSRSLACLQPLRGTRARRRLLPHMSHQMSHGRYADHVAAPAKLTDADVKQIRRRVRRGEHQTVLAAEYGVNRKTIRRRLDALDDAEREQAERTAKKRLHRQAAREKRKLLERQRAVEKSPAAKDSRSRIRPPVTSMRPGITSTTGSISQ